jgi:four helix bundle protein
VGIERFEDLQAWQEARELARIIYRLTRKERFFQDRDLRWQLQGAAVATMSNLAEAHGQSSFEERRRLLELARGAGKKLQSHLYVALDQAYLTVAEVQHASSQADTVAGLIGRMLGNLDRQIKLRRADRPRSRQKRA